MSKIKKLTAAEKDISNGHAIEITIVMDNGLASSRLMHYTEESAEYVQSWQANAKKGVHVIEEIIAPIITGLNPFRQKELDKILYELGKIHDQQKMGLNISLAISLLVFHTNAKLSGRSIPQHVASLYGIYNDTEHTIPTIAFVLPTKNTQNSGGYKNFMLIPARHKSIQESFIMYRAVRTLFSQNYDDVITNTDCIETITRSIEATPYKINSDIFIGLDIGADQLAAYEGYAINDLTSSITGPDLVHYYKNIVDQYSPLIMENPLAEFEDGLWQELNDTVGKQTMVTAEDTSNIIRMKNRIAKNNIAMSEIDITQIYSVTRLFELLTMIRTAQSKVMFNIRGYETDETILEIAMSTQDDFIKVEYKNEDDEEESENVLRLIESKYIHV